MPTLNQRQAAATNINLGMEATFMRQIVAGLSRSAIARPSQWAEKYRVMGEPWPGPWSTRRFPWLVGIQDCRDNLLIIQKSSQVGGSEAVLNRTLYTIDVLRKSVMYILPSLKPDAQEFTQTRFNPALDANEYLRNLFTETDSVTLKVAGQASLYIKGSRTRLKSSPVGLMVYDEVDEMTQENLALAHERMSGQVTYEEAYVSTPTLPEMGINEMFLKSTQDLFFFRCPGCSRYINLEYPRNVRHHDVDPFSEVFRAGTTHGTTIAGEIHGSTAEAVEAMSARPAPNDPAEDVRYTAAANLPTPQYRCHHCDKTLLHEGKQYFLASGEWQSQRSPSRSRGRGVHINRCYSSAKKGQAKEMVEMYWLGQRDQYKLIEFYNSACGIPHTVEGQAITQTHVNEAKKHYANAHRREQQGIITVGIDVGAYFHIEVTWWDMSKVPVSITPEMLNGFARARVLAETKLASPEGIVDFLMPFNFNYLIIDANPERRTAQGLINNYPGRAKMCYYGNVRGHEILEQNNIIAVDRTYWLDMALGRFIKGTIDLPGNVSVEYQDQIKAQKRTYRKDTKGTDVGVWLANRADHFGHARNYSEIALLLAAKPKAQTISRPVY